MPKPIDEKHIIANNPKIDADALRKGIEIMNNLEKMGISKRSVYGLETPETRKTLRYSEIEVRVRRRTNR
jgi:hypothetical protein